MCCIRPVKVDSLIPVARVIGREWRGLRSSVERRKDHLWRPAVIMNDVHESVSFHNLRDKLLARRPCAIQLGPLR
jgi:hypothetical protein